MKGARVEIDRLSVRRGGREVLLRVSLTVEPGELLVVLGPSGSGKTTLLSCINGLIDADAGDVRVDGVSIRDQEPHQLRRRIGYAFQAVGLFPHLTVAENIAVVPRLLRWDAQRVEARISELLKRVGLDAALRERLPHQLSGGQAQRVGVARALAAQPPLLLLDEPFGALDSETRSKMQADLMKLRAQLGVTTVLVSHDLGEALLLADRVAVLIDGQLQAFTTPERLLREPCSPAVAALLSPALARARALVELAAPQLAGS